MDSSSDNTLMLKVKNGDLDKLGLLFERYHRSLFSYFYRFTSRQQESEDLVQGVFERLIRYRHTYTAEDSFRSWIFSIARNLCRDQYRKKNQNCEDVDESIENYPSQRSEDEDVELQKKLLWKAMSQLDESKREIIILSRYEGLLYSEIANLTGLAEGTVKVKMYRAMNDLRSIVNQLSRPEV